MKKYLSILLMLVMVLSATFCGSGDVVVIAAGGSGSDGTNGANGSGGSDVNLESSSPSDSSADFNSKWEDPNGKLNITNGFSTKLVLYKNEVRQSSIVDIMNPYEKKTYNFKEDGFVVLMGVPYEEYVNKSYSEQEPVYYELTYYNTRGEIRDIYVEEQSFPSGSSEITFTNRANYWIELRKGNNNDGQVLGVLPPGKPSSVSVINLAPGEYDIFPTFIQLQKTAFDNKVLGIEEKVLENDVWSRRYDADKKYAEDINPEETGELLVYNKGYISMVNSSGDGFRVMNGSDRLETGAGVSFINPGERLIFELDNLGYVFKQLNISNARGSYKAPHVEVKKGIIYELEITPTYEVVISNPDGTQMEEFRRRIGLDN